MKAPYYPIYKIASTQKPIGALKDTSISLVLCTKFKKDGKKSGEDQKENDKDDEDGKEEEKVTKRQRF